MCHKPVGLVMFLGLTLAMAGAADGAIRKDGTLWETEAAMLTAFPLSTTDAIAGLVPLKNNELVTMGAANYPTPIRSMSSAVGADPCDQPLANPQPQEEGFHGATPDKTGAALTNGDAGGTLDSILEDFAYPAAVFQFELPEPTDIGEIRVYVANDWTGGRDGRIFQDYDVEISTDNEAPGDHVFTPLATEVTANTQICATPPFGDGYSPNVNNGTQVPLLAASLTRVFDDANPVMAAGVTSIRFTFYAVSKTDTAFNDRWLGPIGCTLPPGENPATYWDAEDFDGFKRAFESSIVKEIDVLTVRGSQPFEICDNGEDDDGDGATDTADPDCFGGRDSCPPEDCTNGQDDDGNTLTDCEDPDCRDAPNCNAEVCDDGVDNDGDELIDCDDPDCADFFPDCVCPDPVFDTDGDGDVDQLNFAVFQRCYTGLGDPQSVFDSLPVICKCMDVRGETTLEPDQAISEHDFSVFMNCVTGPNLPGLFDPDCDNVGP